MVMAEWRVKAGDWIEGRGPRNFIIGLIIVNAILLGLATSDWVMGRFATALLGLETVIIALFTLEILIKLFAWGPRFFKSGWNWFDFLIVGISLVPATGPFTILRALRILRVLRLLSTVKRLRLLIDALVAAIPSIGWIIFLLGMVFYIYGVMGTELFGDRFPEWFGTLGAAMFTLFQIMTLESWSMGIARPVMAEFSFAWLYFVSFILVTAFTILNLFIGLIVNTMQAAHWEEEDERRADIEAQAHREREEILALARRADARLTVLEETLFDRSKHKS